jgi:hypothetical protein
MNEANYFFAWKAVSAAGVVEGEYEQVIHGKSLADAVETFTCQHGSLAPDENGVVHVITTISWQPL